MGAWKEKKSLEGYWISYACFHAGWRSTWLNRCILQHLKQQQNNCKNMLWWNKVRWFFTTSLLKWDRACYLAERMCSRLLVCLMGGKHSSLSDISLDFRHLLKPAHWYFVLLQNCWEKNSLKKKKRSSEVSASRAIAGIPSNQSSGARWDTSRDEILEHKILRKRKLGQIKSLGSISCLLVSASLQNKIKKYLTTLGLLDAFLIRDML